MPRVLWGNKKRRNFAPSKVKNELFINLRKNIVIINVIAFGFLILFYLFYITPFVIQKNLELNKTRKMLGIIPKDIFFGILNNEKMGEQEKKD